MLLLFSPSRANVMNGKWWLTETVLWSASSRPADVQVQNFLLHPPSDTRDGSQGKWLQQTCTLFVQNGVQLLREFARQATAWANASVIQANFSQPKPSLEQAGSNRGKISFTTFSFNIGGSLGSYFEALIPDVELCSSFPRWVVASPGWW